MSNRPFENKIIAYNLFKHFLTFGVPLCGLAYYLIRAPSINSEQDLINVCPFCFQIKAKIEKKKKNKRNSVRLPQLKLHSTKIHMIATSKF